MNKITIIFFIIILNTSFLESQNFSVTLGFNNGITANKKLTYFTGGAGISLNYAQPINKILIISGIEFRGIQWGFQTTLNTGIQHTLNETEKRKNLLQYSIQNGMALFYQKKLYVFAAETIYGYKFGLNRKIPLQISTGIRFTVCPVYRNYSDIYNVLEIPVQFTVFFGK